MTLYSREEFEARVAFAKRTLAEREFPNEGTKNVTYQIAGYWARGWSVEQVAKTIATKEEYTSEVASTVGLLYNLLNGAYSREDPYHVKTEAPVTRHGHPLAGGRRR